MSPDLSAVWAKMSPEEKKTVTADAVTIPEVRRESSTKGTIHSQQHAHADAQSTLAGVKNRLVDLQARTGVETIVVAVRCSTDDKLVPQVFTTSPQAEQLFQSLYGDSLEDFAQRLEGYIVSGAAGMLSCPNFLSPSEKLNLFVNEPTPRINYERFEATFTEVYGVVCEGWPLPVFKAPGNMTSKADVKKVIEAWEAGTGRFCRLSKSE
ncbi:hypothetical protein K474DRAFT_1590342, partial [Panus rudis PR-1116 ss-1]